MTTFFLIFGIVKLLSNMYCISFIDIVTRVAMNMVSSEQLSLEWEFIQILWAYARERYSWVMC